MEKKTYYLSELQREAREELEERIKWCRENEEQENSDDLIAEVSDNNIPIYTYDLLQYASNNFDLIYPNELAGDEPDVIKIIQANIYELLHTELYAYVTTIRDNKKETEKE